MAIHESMGLTQDMGITEEMMACPMPRVPLLDQKLRIPHLQEPEYARIQELVIVKTALITQCDN